MRDGLPSDVEFELLTLVFQERSGLEVADLYKERTGRSMSPGTLYTAFRRLRETEWVSVRDAEDEDGRLKFFKVTPKGGAAVRAASRKYARMVDVARGVGALQ